MGKGIKRETGLNGTKDEPGRGRHGKRVSHARNSFEGILPWYAVLAAVSWTSASWIFASWPLASRTLASPGSQVFGSRVAGSRISESQGSGSQYVAVVDDGWW